MGGYDYYHLLTGSDIPLCSMRKLDSFFEANAFKNPSGKMKTNYLSAGKPNAKMASRVKYYNSFIGHWRDSNKCTRKIATASNTLLCYIQRFMGIDRFKRAGVELYCGSSWWSITHDFAGYYLSKSEWAEKQFGRATFAADEFVPHTVLMTRNSVIHVMIHQMGFIRTFGYWILMVEMAMDHQKFGQWMIKKS